MVLYLQFGTFISSICTRYSENIHKKYRNKTLEKIIFSYACAFLISGVMILINSSIKVNNNIAILMVILTFGVKGPYSVLIKKYLKNFTNSKQRTQISGAKIFIEELVTGICLLYASIMSKIFDERYIVAFFGIQFLILFSIVLNISRKHVGKNPEEYSKEDLMQD